MRGLSSLILVGAMAIPSPSAGVSISIDARSIAPGELMLVRVRTDAPAARVDVQAFGHAIPTFRTDSGDWSVLVGIDLDVTPGAYVVRVDVVPAGSDVSATITAERTIEVLPKTFRTRTLTVDEAFVNPPQSAESRIIKEAKDLQETWLRSAPVRLWSGPFVRPVPQPANSAFGTRSVFNNQPRAAHGGADFASPAGTTVLAPNAGRVLLARNLYFTGNTAIVDHGQGLLSLFAHLATMEVPEGDLVVAGQRLGTVGATGRVTGPHLHWAVRAGGARVDPLSLLALLGQDAR